MKTNLAIPTFGLFLLFLTVSCVKDVDFDQADAIAPTPVVELDLIYFNLEGDDFFDETTSTPRLTVRDTTEIKFLDDSEIRDKLKRAEFLFKFTNSISSEFRVDFQFLSEQNDTTYTAQTAINTGSPGAAVQTIFIEDVMEEGLLDLTQANKVVVSVTIPSVNETLEGALNLQSKTTYYLEL